MYDPEVPPVLHATADAYKAAKGTSVNHFYEKLLLLKDRMNTTTGRVLAQERGSGIGSWRLLSSAFSRSGTRARAQPMVQQSLLRPAATHQAGMNFVPVDRVRNRLPTSMFGATSSVRNAYQSSVVIVSGDSARRR